MSVEIFFCYAREDEALRLELEKQLQALKRQGLITMWHDRNINAGDEWEREIDKRLDSAQIILLLVSPDFMASDYSYSKEMMRAMQRHDAGEAIVIPIILRPVYWQGAPFGKLQVLPTDAKHITSPIWPNQDEAFFNVAEGIRKAAEMLDARTLWLNEAKTEYEAKQYKQALAAFNKVLDLDPNFVEAHKLKGNILLTLDRYEEALAAFDRAIELKPD